MNLSCGRKSEQTCSSLGLRNSSWDLQNIKRKWKGTVWWVITFNRVIRLYDFDEPIVNGDNYLHKLNNYFFSMLGELSQNMNFQQDSNPLHYTCALWDRMDVEPPNCRSGGGFPTSGSDWSSDLTPCDFSFSGYAADKDTKTAVLIYSVEEENNLSNSKCYRGNPPKYMEEP